MTKIIESKLFRELLCKRFNQNIQGYAFYCSFSCIIKNQSLQSQMPNSLINNKKFLAMYFAQHNFHIYIYFIYIMYIFAQHKIISKTITMNDIIILLSFKHFIFGHYFKSIFSKCQVFIPRMSIFLLTGQGETMIKLFIHFLLVGI